MTFGLGHNHGLGWGTSLSEDTGYNSNIGKQRYFRIDQETEAIAEATRIAENRGDTKALPISKQGYARYDILLPEAFSGERWSDVSLDKLKEYLNQIYSLDNVFLCHCAADAIGSL